MTGGGSTLQHLPQLVEYITGMDVRIGFPNEHLASDNPDEVSGPIFSTGVGLVIHGLEYRDRVNRKAARNKQPVDPAKTKEADLPEDIEMEEVTTESIQSKRPGWFTNFTERIREMLNDEDI